MTFNKTQLALALTVRRRRACPATRHSLRFIDGDGGRQTVVAGETA